MTPKSNGLDTAPAVTNHPGSVNFGADLNNWLVHVSVQRPLDIMPTTVSISVFRFLELAAQLQAAVNQGIAGLTVQAPPGSRPF
jgi:hypothetical protein